MRDCGSERRTSMHGERRPPTKVLNSPSRTARSRCRRPPRIAMRRRPLAKPRTHRSPSSGNASTARARPSTPPSAATTPRRSPRSRVWTTPADRRTMRAREHRRRMRSTSRILSYARRTARSTPSAPTPPPATSRYWVRTPTAHGPPRVTRSDRCRRGRERAEPGRRRSCPETAATSSTTPCWKRSPAVSASRARRPAR